MCEQRLIDANALIRALIQKEPFSDCARVVIAECIEEVRHAPTIEEHNDAEFWQKRADEYCRICVNLIGEMQRGVIFDSVKIDANGITFMKKQGEEHESD